MLTLSYFLQLFPERPSPFSTSGTPRKWLRAKADPWDILPKKQWPGEAELIVQEGFPKSQVYPGEQVTNIKHSPIQVLRPALMVETLLDRATKRLHSAQFCLSNTMSHVSEELPASSHWCRWQNPSRHQSKCMLYTGSDIPEHNFFQLLLYVLCIETNALMFLSPIISHYSTTG